MTIREYRRIKGLTQPELAKELRKVADGIDGPLISKMERGLCEPTVTVQAYIDAQAENLKDSIVELTDSQVDILMMLMQASEDNPVTRMELVIRTSQDDRKCRKDIEAMRLRGLRICSRSGREGYWLAKGEDDYKALRGEMIKRIKSLAKTLKAMDENCEGQILIRNGGEKNVC